MNTVSLIVAALGLSLGLSAAQASDPVRTGSIGRTADAGSAPGAPGSVAAAPAEAAAVSLPEVSVTTVTPVARTLPPLKPLPKWDPRVCIGC